MVRFHIFILFDSAVCFSGCDDEFALPFPQSHVASIQMPDWACIGVCTQREICSLHPTYEIHHHQRVNLIKA